MAYMDYVDGALRSRLVNDTDINALVKARVYPSYLAKITNPQFPLICFNRLPSPRDFRYSKRIQCEYSVWIYSTKGFSETDKIFEEMKNSLDNEFFDLPESLGRVGFRLLDNPSQDVDPDQELYYATFSVMGLAFFT